MVRKGVGNVVGKGVRNGGLTRENVGFTAHTFCAKEKVEQQTRMEERREREEREKRDREESRDSG